MTFFDILSRKHFLWFVFISALVIRIGFVLMLKTDGYYFSDTRHYDKAAQSLLQGEGWGERYTRAPLYPLFLAGIYAVFGQSFTAVRLFESMLGAVLVLLIYFYARRCFSEKIARWASLLCVVFPHFILLCGLLYPTNLFTLLLSCGFYFLIRNRTKYDMIWAGAAAGLAALAVPAMIFILPVWILAILLHRFLPVKARFHSLLLFVIAFSIVMMPWVMRNYARYDRLVLVQNLPHTVLPDFSSPDKSEIDRGFPKTTDYLQEHPHGTQKDNVHNTVMHYIKNPVSSFRYLLSEQKHFWALYPDRLDTGSDVYRKSIHDRDMRMVLDTARIWDLVPVLSTIVMLPVFLFAFIGILVSTWSWCKGTLLGSIIAISAGYSLIFAEVRYRIPIEPFILLFTAIALDWCYEKSKLLKR